MSNSCCFYFNLSHDFLFLIVDEVGIAFYLYEIVGFNVKIMLLGHFLSHFSFDMLLVYAEFHVLDPVEILFDHLRSEGLEPNLENARLNGVFNANY